MASFYICICPHPRQLLIFSDSYVLLHDLHLNFLKIQTNRMCARFFSVSFWVQAVYFIQKASLLAGERKETRKKYASTISWLWGEAVHGMRKLWRPYSQSYFWAEPPKIMLGRKPVSMTWGKWGAPMTSLVFWADPPEAVGKTASFKKMNIFWMNILHLKKWFF